MKYPKELTTLEVLGIAIQSEIESARYYQKMKRAVHSRVFKDKLGFLASEELNHQRILTDYYHYEFSAIRLAKPIASWVPKPEIPKGKVTVDAILKTAMKAEQEAENFYATFARQITSAQGQLLLRYLAKVENNHYYLLKNELDIMDQGQKIKGLQLMYQMDKTIHVGP